jgi:hypothetical protein
LKDDAIKGYGLSVNTFEDLEMGSAEAVVDNINNGCLPCTGFAGDNIDCAQPKVDSSDLSLLAV